MKFILNAGGGAPHLEVEARGTLAHRAGEGGIFGAESRRAPTAAADAGGQI